MVTELNRDHNNNLTGYEQSNPATFVIPVGSLGADSDYVDFGRPWFGISAWIPGTNGLTQAGSLVAQVSSYDNDGTLCPLWKFDGTERWASGAGLHAGFSFTIAHALNVQQIRFVTDVATNAEVTIYVQGYDPGMGG